jgi:cyclophilin family peptidyl-prolyl cis-trans isomerase
MFQLKPLSFLLLTSLTASMLMGVPGTHERVVAQTVRFETNVGNIEVQLHPNDAPLTVANFLSYVNADAGSNYDGTFLHRSVPNFIVQGGGFYTPVQLYTIAGFSTPFVIEDRVPAQLPVPNEFGISNTRGTIAMAKLGGDPDSATNQWFFNIADNSANLDNQNGGFTVFGTVVLGLDIVDAIQTFGRINLNPPDQSNPSDPFNAGRPGAFGTVPLVNGNNFVIVNTVSVVDVLLGDVNLDGTVSFADIPAFINVLTAGNFQNEADCDQSATVDFADIPAFIAILTGL